MGKFFPAMRPEHEEFIRKQRMFFVATAPLSPDGHINISPKGYDVLRIFSLKQVAYLDLTGSGNETSAHVQENGRITFMFVSFEGSPLILRLYGNGRAILPGTTEWDELITHFDPLPGARQIISADIYSVQTSCGFGVPLFSYSGDRDTLLQSAAKKGEQALLDYQREKNAISLDGIVTPLGRRWSEPVLPDE
jgi:hypothetical protein